jgi:4-hydroxy-4-methyl-2-oxoglutarate aldolase
MSPGTAPPALPEPWIAPATLHEVLGRRGVLNPCIKPVHPHFRVFGTAFPVRCAAGTNLALHQAIYRAKPGDVLVADIVGPTDEDFGYWGEIMCEAAKSRELGGLVINGTVRDCAAIGEVGFPVLATGLCIRGTSKEATEDPFPGRLELGSVVVEVGDYIVGDADGVLCIPAAEWDTAVTLGRDRDLREVGYIDALRKGFTTLELMNLDH